MGLPLDELLRRGREGPSPLVGMLEADPIVVEDLVELLRQRFPTDMVGVFVGHDSPVTRVIGRSTDPDAALELSAAAREASRAQRPRLLAVGAGHIYATPHGRHGALAVRRSNAPLTVDDQRYVELLAIHLR